MICHCQNVGAYLQVRPHSISLRKNEQGEIIGFRSVSRDITERKQMEQKLEEMATHDFLTGLPNRVLLLDRFNMAAALARVGGDEFILLMMETKRMENATNIAQKILDAFAEPLLIDGHQLHLSTSIGIAIYPKDAQAALFRVKPNFVSIC